MRKRLLILLCMLIAQAGQDRRRTLTNASAH